MSRILKVLVACEESQAVTKEFRRLGHEAYSNDILPCSGGHSEWHLQMDIMEAMKMKKWDIIIIHVPCQKIAVSGNRWYGQTTLGFNQRLEAIGWSQRVWDYAGSICDYVALENPVGTLNRYGNFPKPQYIQPWQFGHGETKKTGLWLYNLPPLKPTDIVEGREQRIWKMPPRADRGKERSKTYPGIARAMATQWSEYILSQTV